MLSESYLRRVWRIFCHSYSPMMLEFSRKSILQPQLAAGRSLIFDDLSATAFEMKGGGKHLLCVSLGMWAL
jgi:hypothetical protein